MTAAYRMKGLGWFGSCVAVVLGFYLVSLQVAAERKKLDLVNQRVAGAERDLRALETEFDTRANLAQLERWNGDTLALSAPTAGQFVRDEAQLASLNVNAPGPEIETAALVVPAGPTAPAAPIIPAAQPGGSAPIAGTAVASAAASTAVAQPAVHYAAAQVAAVASPSTAVKASAARALTPAHPTHAAVAAERQESARATAAVAKVRPQAVAMLDRKLLSDTTLGDLLSGAHVEAGRRR